MASCQEAASRKLYIFCFYIFGKNEGPKLNSVNHNLGASVRERGASYREHHKMINYILIYILMLWVSKYFNGRQASHNTQNNYSLLSPRSVLDSQNQSGISR